MTEHWRNCVVSSVSQLVLWGCTLCAQGMVINPWQQWQKPRSVAGIAGRWKKLVEAAWYISTQGHEYKDAFIQLNHASFVKHLNLLLFFHTIPNASARPAYSPPLKANSTFTGCSTSWSNGCTLEFPLLQEAPPLLPGRAVGGFRKRCRRHVIGPALGWMQQTFRILAFGPFRTLFLDLYFLHFLSFSYILLHLITRPPICVIQLAIDGHRSPEVWFSVGEKEIQCLRALIDHGGLPRKP